MKAGASTSVQRRIWSALGDVVIVDVFAYDTARSSSATDEGDNMATRSGVGFSEKSVSVDAGAEAARTAMTAAGIDRCDLAIVFTTSKHDPAKIRDGIRSVVGPNARVIGGYG